MEQIKYKADRLPKDVIVFARSVPSLPQIKIYKDKEYVNYPKDSDNYLPADLIARLSGLGYISDVSDKKTESEPRKKKTSENKAQDVEKKKRINKKNFK
jgi:hypothetical protein